MQKLMKCGPVLLLLFVIGAEGARLRARETALASQEDGDKETVIAMAGMTRENATAQEFDFFTAQPYVLDRCTEVDEIFGGADYMGKDPMTLDVCYTFCNTRAAFYFGVVKGNKCWCGSQYQARIGGSVICDVPCAGDKKLYCGGKYAASVYIMGKGPCDTAGMKKVGVSTDKDLNQADEALAKVVKQAEKMVEKENKKIEIKAVKRIDQAKHLVDQAEEDVKKGKTGDAKKKLRQAKRKVVVAKRKFDKMKQVGKTPSARERQAEQDIKITIREIKDAVKEPTPANLKEADQLLKQAAAKPPPKRAPVCLSALKLSSLEYVNINGQFLRHQGFRLKASPKGTNKVFKQDATFEIVSGLLASANCGISFRSKNYPDRYIRHANFELKLDKKSDSELYKKDATFFAVAPKDASLGGAYIFRSSNFPDRYMHIRPDGLAWLDQLAAGDEKQFTFKIGPPLFSALGGTIIKMVNGGDWVDVDCGSYEVIGGGCNAKVGPHKMQMNGPRLWRPDGGTGGREGEWRCGGHGGKKQVWAVCAPKGPKGITRKIVQKNGGDWTTVACPAGTKLISGGCDAHKSPHILQYNGPDGDSKWKCGGHGGDKRVWAVCTADAETVIKEKSGGDWVKVECDDGKKVVGGGCNANKSPYIMQYNGPDGGSAWKCGGHGGPKTVWAICEA